MFLGTCSCKTWSSTLFPTCWSYLKTDTWAHTHAWHLSPFELARTRTRTHAHTHTLSNHECTCMPGQKLKNHNISFSNSRMHSSGRPVCIHTTHKNPELQQMCRSCLIESTCTHSFSRIVGIRYMAQNESSRNRVAQLGQHDHNT